MINQFQGVSFQVAEAAMLLDACRAMARMTVGERREALIEAAHQVIADHGVEVGEGLLDGVVDAVALQHRVVGDPYAAAGA